MRSGKLHWTQSDISLKLGRISTAAPRLNLARRCCTLRPSRKSPVPHPSYSCFSIAVLTSMRGKYFPTSTTGQYGIIQATQHFTMLLLLPMRTSSSSFWPRDAIPSSPPMTEVHVCMQPQQMVVPLFQNGSSIWVWIRARKAVLITSYNGRLHSNLLFMVTTSSLPSFFIHEGRQCRPRSCSASQQEHHPSGLT